MVTHYLKPNCKGEMPSNVIYFDTETYTENELQTLKLGHAIHSLYKRDRKGIMREYNEELAFTTRKQFYDWVDKIVTNNPHTKIWGVAHNTAFDFNVLALHKHLTERNGWGEPAPFVNHNGVFLYYTQRNDGTQTALNFVSTTNWWHTSLKDIAKKFGSFKLDIDLDDAPDDELAVYCRQDVLAVKAVFEGTMRFIKDNDLGNFKPTSASMALSAFTHRFMEPKSIVVHDHEKLIAFERESYKGGRVECMRLFNPLKDDFVTDVYDLDINSMYPTVMRAHDYPCGPRFKSPAHINKDCIPEAWGDDFVFARCEMDLKRPCIGIKRDDMLQFPIGHITDVITQPEIDWLNAHPEDGSIVRYIDAIPYFKRHDLFTDYVDFFYGLKSRAKLEGDTAMEAFSKLCLNSLYGKFGQRSYPPIEEAKEEEEGEPQARNEAVRTIMRELNTCTWSDQDYLYTLLGERLMRQARGHLKDSDPTPHTVVSISSSVTAYARMMLWEAMRTAGLDNCYYCDTDSVFTNREGYDALTKAGWLHETELGKLKLEKHFDQFACYGPKDYSYDGNWKCKGIKKNALQTDWESFSQELFETGKKHFINGDPDGVVVSRINKTLSRNYKKGTRLANGKVRPFVLKEW